MNRFLKVFGKEKCKVIGMIHVEALPGTPRYAGNWQQIFKKAEQEAKLYNNLRLDGVIIENMHDVPYVQERLLGPETVACMTRVAQIVRDIMPKQTPCGVQVLAGGNKQALAIAKASQLQFIRAEGFAFGHLGDEGYMDACAGELLRYRKHIDAEDVLVFTDIKKKHSSHAITADVSLLETAHAAEFFYTDGIILTGTATGQEASTSDLKELAGKLQVPILIGSGVTIKNVEKYFKEADALIVGSHFKSKGDWRENICDDAVSKFMTRVCQLRHL
ncbi:hypothetical protein KR222_000378 [Zaprionus bogoriensis]|nr:hypothetical protein KR222_000378 [Zaprionus bogoriensis]